MRFIISCLTTVIVGLGVLTACNSNEQKTRTSPQASASVAPAANDGARRITVPELKDMLASNEAIVLDVRNQSSYDQAHIRGARLIPEAEIVNHLDELPRNKLIVTYCS